ncbi:MAG TPA: response regulator transcription factor [Nitrospira sp.]|nr:response regulator transcription factor [Nitrospira sp.]
MAFNLSKSSRVHGNLTDRQIEILRLIADGLRNREIAERLDIHPKTVEYHKSQIYAKIGAHSPALAVRFAIRNGYLNPATEI